MRNNKWENKKIKMMIIYKQNLRMKERHVVENSGSSDG